VTTFRSGQRPVVPRRCHLHQADDPGPVLLDVITNPNEVAIPGKVKLKQAWGFTVSKIEESVLSHGDS
jgi:hypothetical protein